MKYTYKIFIILILSNLTCLGQKKIKNEQFIINDTIFLERVFTQTEYHAIFIDTNKKSNFYSKINNFEIDEYDQKNYNETILQLKEDNTKFNKYNIEEIPSKLVMIKNYKGKLYNYCPSDFISHFQIKITDSTFILYTGEGPIANKIDSLEKISDKKYKIKLSGIYSGFSNMILHIIDLKNGIVIIENQDKSNTSYYCLMIDSDKIKNLPIIVNYCRTRKWLEYNFEEPNYRQLISN